MRSASSHWSRGSRLSLWVAWPGASTAISRAAGARDLDLRLGDWYGDHFWTLAQSLLGEGLFPVWHLLDDAAPAEIVRAWNARSCPPIGYAHPLCLTSDREANRSGNKHVNIDLILGNATVRQSLDQSLGFVGLSRNVLHSPKLRLAMRRLSNRGHVPTLLSSKKIDAALMQKRWNEETGLYYFVDHQ